MLPASAFNNTPKFPCCTPCNTQLQHSTTLPSFLVHSATHSFSIQQHSQVSLLYTMQHTASAFSNTPKFPCCAFCNTQLEHSTLYSLSCSSTSLHHSTLYSLSYSNTSLQHSTLLTISVLQQHKSTALNTVNHLYPAAAQVYSTQHCSSLLHVEGP